MGIAFCVSAYLPGAGLHVGPPVQEDLGGLQVAILGSIVESDDSNLSKYVFVVSIRK